ncbi:ATP-dependent helicase [Clostridiaceae bacterium HSG29]|nr:ATP-dependent helicase [Clostridiaceae bacterium HSG29]
MAWDDQLETNTPAFDFAADTASSIRVLAGPGTGKSFGLQRRVARLLEEGVKPETILAVTFTRTAAQDLKKEMAEVGVDGADKIIAKTLHSFCFSLLNNKSIIESTGRYPRPMIEHELKPMYYDLGKQFGKLRDKEKRLRAFEAIWARLQSETPGYQFTDIDQMFEREVMNWLVIHQSMLFGEMIRETYKYLRDNPQCIERHLFEHVLVDEYQDLNKAEQLVIDYLAENANIAVIGDDDQSIYSFKFAHPEGIREFPNTHDNCDSIDFAQCRRCPKKVVGMASKLISNNTNRTLGALLPFDTNLDGNVKIVQYKDLNSEIEGISNMIQRQIDTQEILPKDVLVLVPVRKIGYRVRNSLVARNVNAKSYFRESALTTDFSKELFSLINLLARPNDLVAWRYLLGVGSTNYKTKSYKRVLEYAQENNLNIIETLDKLESKQIIVQYTNHLIDRYKIVKSKISNMMQQISQDRNSIINLIDKKDEDNSDLRCIIVSTIEEIGLLEDEDVEKWLEKIYTSVVECISFPQNVIEQDHVRIMSLHASKGLSAKFVVVMSCIDDLLPRVDSDATSEEKRIQIEEQRRLFYVAITRCKCSMEYSGELVISSFVGLPGNEALQINIPASPINWRTTRASRFISEFQNTAPNTISIDL